MRNKAFIIVLYISVFFSGAAMAQPGDPGGDPDQPVPLTGIEWLLLAGAGLGAGKIMSKSKKDT